MHPYPRCHPDRRDGDVGERCEGHGPCPVGSAARYQPQSVRKVDLPNPGGGTRILSFLGEQPRLVSSP